MRFCDCQAINAAMRRGLTGATSSPSTRAILGVFLMNANVRRGLLLVGALGGSAASQAAAVDVTALTADIAAQSVPIVAVGGAVLLIMIAVKAFKWVRAAMS